jgi:hypothetical protein
MDLNGWLVQAVIVRGEIAAASAQLRQLDSKWRDLEEALRGAIKNPNDARKVGTPSDGVGSL